MSKKYSIAEARDRLSAIVHQAEAGEEITLTRRGKPVAVLLSRREFARLQGKSIGFWWAYQAFRQQVEVDRLGLRRGLLADLRDQTPGRDVSCDT